MRAILQEAIQAGARWAPKRKGIVVYSEKGDTAMCHFTTSDRRAPANFRAKLRRMGVLS